jgi:hypothetical protein
MLSKKSIKTVLTVALAALFVLAFAYQTSAYSSGGSSPFTYTGKILSLDNNYKWVTVQAGPNDELSFRLDDGVAVMQCNMSGHFEDLKIGDHVTVTYFEEGNGGYIASEVDWLPMGMTRC